MESSTGNITHLLNRLASGDQQAAAQLVPLWMSPSHSWKSWTSGKRESLSFALEESKHGLSGLHRVGPAEKYFLSAGLVFGAS